jgi:hypothetical protein
VGKVLGDEHLVVEHEDAHRDVLVAEPRLNARHGAQLG